MLGEPPHTWLEHLPLAAGVVRDGRFTFVNAALAELVGYSREEMTNMPFLEPVAEEHRAMVRDRHANRLAGVPVTERYELDIVRRDSTRRHCEICVSSVGIDTIFQLRDETAAAEHATQLRALAHLGATVQAEQTRERVLARVDEGCAALGLVAIRMEPRGEGLVITSYHRPGGLASFEESVGVGVNGLLRPWTPATTQAWRDGISYIDDLPMQVQAFFTTVGERARDFIRQVGFQHAAFLRIDVGGAPSHLLLLISTWLRHDDIPTLTLFGAQITAALAAAQALADLSLAQEQLVQSERLAALGEMAAVVAHEVRNPLGSIFNAVGALRRLLGDREGDTKLLLGIVAEEATRLNEIVGDLLDFARPVRPELHPGSLNEVVRDAVASAIATATGVITLDVVTDAEVPVVPLDARLVRQAIINIALNAVQSIAGDGKIGVHISSVVRDASAHARVEISDSGPGIPRELLPRLFEPFFTTRATGTGLGLAVVKRIIEGHGGRISVASEPGSTTFTVDFPA